MEAPKKAGRVPSQDGSTFQIIQHRTLQDLVFESGSEVSALVREVGPIQHMIGSRDVVQHAEHRIACSKSRVSIHSSFRGADRGALATISADADVTTGRHQRESQVGCSRCCTIHWWLTAPRSPAWCVARRPTAITTDADTHAVKAIAATAHA
jgi:hypothetical protein